MAEKSKPSQIAIEDAIKLLQTFRGADLTRTIDRIEKSLSGVSADGYASVLTTSGAKAKALGAAGLIKQMAGQINVVIHTLVYSCAFLIFCGQVKSSNTHRLVPETPAEPLTWRLASASRNSNSSAGRAGRNRFAKIPYSRISLRWRAQTPKDKYLYVVGTEHGEKFFNRGRALSSVLSHSVKLRKEFTEKFGDRYRTVRDYLPRKGLVVIQDVSPFVPELVAAAVEAPETEEE